MSSLLQIQDLQKQFTAPDGSIHQVLHIPHFQMAAGEECALRGESGSGKTTFLHLIAGILSPDRGTIQLAGDVLTGKSEAERDRIRARNVGYIFQTFNLLQGYTALENVMLGMKFGVGVQRDFARQLLQRVGLEQRLHHYPRQLSTGQQQRVAVARALAARPKLVLADEPTGNLDRTRAMEALTLIREICREHGAALLLVSHDPEILAQFQHVQDFHQLNKTLQTISPQTGKGTEVTS